MYVKELQLKAGRERGRRERRQHVPRANTNSYTLTQFGRRYKRCRVRCYFMLRFLVYFRGKTSVGMFVAVIGTRAFAKEMTESFVKKRVGGTAFWEPPCACSAACKRW